MTPELALHNSANGGWRDVVQVGNSVLLHTRLFQDADVNHVQFMKLRASMTCAAMNRFSMIASRLSIFGNLVGYIFRIRPQKEMLRILASSIIALMAHLKSIWNFGIENLVRKSVRPIISTISPEVSISINGCSHPNPARAKLWAMRWYWAILVDLFPKPLNVFFVHKNKTPVELEVKPTQQRRQQVGRALDFRSLFLKAVSMPEPIYA